MTADVGALAEDQGCAHCRELEAQLAAARSALAAVREVRDAAIEAALNEAREQLR